METFEAGQCQDNCSRRYGNDFSRWCPTCQSWKKELHQHNRYRKHWDNIKWTKLDTIDFPQTYEEVSKVFIQDFTHVRRGVFKDLGALMSLFRNLKIFNCIINDTLIADIQHSRNTFFAHNYDVALHDVEKTQCLNCLSALLKIPDIACTQSSKTYLDLLEELKTSQKIPKRILKIPDVQYTIAIIGNVSHRKTPDEMEENAIANPHLKECFDNDYFHFNRFRYSKKTQTHVFIAKVLRFLLHLTIIVILLYGLLSKYQETVPVKGCLSVRFDAYWKSDLDFDSYVAEKSNESVIERLWIHQKILTNAATRRKGILLSADMGFGKSTIVSNIVCADPTCIWYSLRQQTLVYHMCRYDWLLSSKPEVFVRNLAGAFVRTNPEIGNAILSDDMALAFLYGECSMDPVACLEFSVLNKLKHFNDNRKHLIIIDAIDECETSGGTDLVGLLYKKISFFPDNFRFLITSRNIERLIYKFKQLEHIDLQAYEQNNMQDIRLYLENSEKMTSDEIVKLTDISGRNFLHVKLYLKYCKDLKIGECDFIPESLEKIYQLNFERVFGEKGDLFEEFISVFEVLCSLQNPIDENVLFEVIDLKSKEIRRKTSQILGNELRHFIKISDGYISFQHKSISDFLTDSSRKHFNFYVDSKNGHKLFAKYLLNVLNLSKTDNLVEIVYHVAMSREPDYENIMFRYVRELKSGRVLFNSTYLNLAAKQVNCYETLKLFIKLIIPSLRHPAEQRFAANHTWIKNVLSEAAFIAAQYGNEKSLLALLDHGSDIMFTHLNSSLSLQLILNVRYRTMCKYELFCGYNMLHISAQRGYIKIVKELLRRNIRLLYQHNSMQMNAFHLAAENGHVPVLRDFLKFNSSLADSHSLYLACENGHATVVVLLLNYVKEKCLPCNVDISWRPSVQLVEEPTKGYLSYRILQEFNLTDSTKLENLEGWKKKLEDTRLITCDTPLNAAVRNGHIEIVKILVKKSVRTVNCSIYDGSIPLFTAVKYNRNEIFKLLYNISDLSHRCKGISINQSKLTASEKQITDSMKCPDYARVEHLLATYDNIQLIEFLFQKGHRNWESRDREGCTPLHYAFCHGSYKFVKFFIFENRLPLNVLSRSFNGSTPFHSAANCQSFILHQYKQKVNQSKLPTIPDVEDNQGHSILQYGLNRSISADDLIRIDKIGKDDFTFSLFVVVLSFHHNLLHKDKRKNNFLHYASKAGNYWAFSTIRELKILQVLLNQRNQNNRTPLEVAFDSLPRRESFEAVRIPHNCSLTDVFFVECKANVSVLLSPHEYFIFTVFQYIYKKGNFSEVNLGELLEISINKSRIYPILIMKVYAEQEVQNVLEMSSKIPFLLSKSNSPYITELLLNTENALNCDGRKSALHEILHNDRNIQWTFHSLAFLNPLFQKYSVKFLDECFDDQGYNLLHRSIMGAHLKTIQYLIDQGMNPWQLSKDNKTALEICIYNSPYTDNGVIPTYYTSGSHFHTIQYVSSVENQGVVYDNRRLISFDETAKFLLSTNEKKRQLIMSLLCDFKNNKDLGLIHIAAAKGLFVFLQTAVQIYGLDYLRCEDKFGVTPMYIAHIYKQKEIVGWLKKLKLDIKRPERRSENVLLFNIIDNYKYLAEYDWTCLLRYRYKYSGIIRNQILKCVKNNHRPIHHSWMFKTIIFSMLRNLTISLHDIKLPISEKLMETLHWMYTNKITMNNLSSKHKTVIMYNLLLSNNNLCFLQFFQNKAYTMMRKLMMFGADDKDFYYVQLLSLVRKELNVHRQNTSVNFSNLFFDVYGKQHIHFSKLKMRSELHRNWLKQTHIRLSDDFNIFVKYKENLLKPNDLLSKMCKNAVNQSLKILAKKED